MYLAIVFLPLLGRHPRRQSSRWPARARVIPARSPSDDHHAPAHGQSVHVGGDHAVIHATHDEPGGHDDHAHDRAAGRGLARSRTHHHVAA